MQELVKTHQEELLRLAWLLTGNRSESSRLVRRVFLQFFGSGVEGDSRTALFGVLACCYLSGAVTFGDELELDDLTREERLTLVYGALAGISLSELNQMVAFTGVPLSTEAGDLERRTGVGVQQLLVAGMEYPRVDLWPAIAADLAEKRRDLHKRRLTTAGTFALCCFAVVLIGLAASYRNGASSDASTQSVIPTPRMASVEEVLEANRFEPPTPTPFVPAGPAAEVASLMVVQLSHPAHEENSFQTSFALLDPATQMISDTGILLNGDPWQGLQISPDGGTLILTVLERVDEAASYRLLALDSATFELRWQQQLDPIAFENGRNPIRVSTALTSSNVFLVTWHDEHLDRIAIRSFDLETGNPDQMLELDVESKPVDEGSTWFDVSLDTSPDVSRLFVSLTYWEYTVTRNSVAERVTYSISLPKLELVGHLVHDEATLSTNWRGFVSQQGSSILHGYLSPTRDLPEAGYQFLDLDTGRHSTIPLPSEQPDPERQNYLIHVPSNDGRRVYLIGARTGEVFVVNLVEQRLERRFSIDTGAFSVLVGSGTGQFLFDAGAVLSMDGSRLYLIAAGRSWMQQGDTSYQSGIWTIDLSSWTIVDFLPVRGALQGLYPAGDDCGMVARRWFYEHRLDQLQQSELIYIRTGCDPATEQLFDTAELDEDGYWQLRSLSELYRQQYGRSPTINGNAPQDIENYTVLPRFEVAVAGSVASGVAAGFEIRVLHPTTGEVLNQTGGGVRFDARSSLFARLRSTDGQSQIVMLANTEPGIWWGSVKPPADGGWVIDVVVFTPDGRRSIIPEVGMMAVGPTFVGSDGNRYLLSMTTSPRSPVVDEEITFRLRLVNAETGERLPAGVDFDLPQPVLEGNPIEALPETVSLSLDVHGRYRVVNLERVSRSTWEGTVTVDQPGIVGSMVNIQIRHAPRISLPGPDLHIEGGEP